MPTRREILTAASLTVLGIPALGFIYKTGEESNKKYWEEIRLHKEKNALETGVKGKRNIVDLRSVPGFQNVNAGLQAVIETTPDGKTTQLLQFAWETSGSRKRIIVSKIPIDKVQFNKPTDKDTFSSVDFGIESLSMVWDNPNALLPRLTTFTILEQDQAKFSIVASNR